MRIAYITAGAGGMLCGSCLHDNTLVAALQSLGHDAVLIPTYTPIRTDEDDVSIRRVFFGGINVFLQQKSSLFRHTPWFLDRFLDAPGLLRWVSKFAVKTQAEDLAELTLSMLRGEHGHQRKEIDKLSGWLESDVRPEIINLTAVLLSGVVRKLRERLRVPILGTLQGDDIFLEALPDEARRQALKILRENCREFAGFIATSRYYADFMAEYLEIQREKIHVVYPGLDLRRHTPLANVGQDSDPIRLSGQERNPIPRSGEQPSGQDRNPILRAQGRGEPFTIGYFARICPEKGLHHLVEAFCLLKQMPDIGPCRLRVSGWLGENNKPYFEELKQTLKNRGLAEHFEHVEAPDHASKVQFLQGLDVLSVPTVYREPKGLYVLEALANGVPVVQPRHGSFPELIEATGGGLLVEPNDPADLANALRQLMDNPTERATLAQAGQRVVHERFHARGMAEQTLAIYRNYLA
ncbi:MAG: glycosyltransferase family 4 protein [Gemmataceae bacterium]|nr:glycosyltransferase family 4 protein [Gemmataceae bacterium]